MSNTLLVTGAQGFLGRYVVRHFSEKGWDVIGIDSAPTENAPLSDLACYYNLKLPDTNFSGVVKKHSPDLCVHCAGTASVGLSIKDPVRDFYGSTALTFEILNTLRSRASQCEFILLSSAAVYGNPRSLPISEIENPDPISPYGFHKWQCEQLCREFTAIYGLRTASVRIFSAYGPGLRRQVLWDICRNAILKKSLTLQGSGVESRDFIHAIDIARALEVITNKAPMKGEVYNLAAGHEITIETLAHMALKELNIQCELQFNGIVPPGTPTNWCADITKLKQLGFDVSVSLEHGVAAFSSWCKTEFGL
jgi:UDP-glucose 4-epimerase